MRSFLISWSPPSSLMNFLRGGLGKGQCFSCVRARDACDFSSLEVRGAKGAM